jgi:hypothetical protein
MKANDVGFLGWIVGQLSRVIAVFGGKGVQFPVAFHLVQHVDAWAIQCRLRWVGRERVVARRVVKSGDVIALFEINVAFCEL